MALNKGLPAEVVVVEAQHVEDKEAPLLLARCQVLIHDHLPVEDGAVVDLPHEWSAVRARGREAGPAHLHPPDDIGAVKEVGPVFQDEHEVARAVRLPGDLVLDLFQAADVL